MSNIELLKEVSVNGTVTWVILDPVSTEVKLRTTNVDLAQRCYVDIQKYGYIQAEK